MLHFRFSFTKVGKTNHTLLFFIIILFLCNLVTKKSCIGRNAKSTTSMTCLAQIKFSLFVRGPWSQSWTPVQQTKPTAWLDCECTCNMAGKVNMSWWLCYRDLVLFVLNVQPEKGPLLFSWNTGQSQNLFNKIPAHFVFTEKITHLFNIPSNYIYINSKIKKKKSDRLLETIAMHTAQFNKRLSWAPSRPPRWWQYHHSGPSPPPCSGGRRVQRCTTPPLATGRPGVVGSHGKC